MNTNNICRLVHIDISINLKKINIEVIEFNYVESLAVYGYFGFYSMDTWKA